MVERSFEDPRAFLVAMPDRPPEGDGLGRLVEAKHEEPARADGHLVALVEARRRHLVAVDHHVLGVGRGLDLEPPLLPANPPVHRPDPLAGQDDVARRARAEEDGVVARQLDELHASLTVVNFEGGHARVFSSGFGFVVKVGVSR